MPAAFTELPLITTRDLVCEARSRELRTTIPGWRRG
jgi:hypothetical protein